MSVITLILIVWAIAVACIFIMKKIEPDAYKIYAVYALAVCVALTVVVGWHVS